MRKIVRSCHFPIGPRKFPMKSVESTLSFERLCDLFSPSFGFRSVASASSDFSIKACALFRCSSIFSWCWDGFRCRHLLQSWSGLLPFSLSQRLWMSTCRIRFNQNLSLTKLHNSHLKKFLASSSHFFNELKKISNYCRTKKSL